MDIKSCAVDRASKTNGCDEVLRVRSAGKFFRLGPEKFYVKGFSYGPFAPNEDGQFYPSVEQVSRDFRRIRELGANTVRVYTPPPMWLLDAALETDLRVFIDVPWEKHRCFFEDWGAIKRAKENVRQIAVSAGRHPAVFAISVVNELPADVVRFQGRKRVTRFVGDLVQIVKDEAPGCPATFVNFPTTEFLDVKSCDFYCFNVYLHDVNNLGSYFDRLQHIAGNKPLMIGEYGIDTSRNGEHEQANLLQKHVRCAVQRGLAGTIVFSYTDDWFTGGHQIEDWRFGVTTRDRHEKPAAKALKRAWSDTPRSQIDAEHPKISVVVCTYNGGQTLRDCLTSLMRLEYPDYEVIVIDDGSSDNTGLIAKDFPQAIYHRQANCGLGVARNVGAKLADGEIVAYTDDDCRVDEHWLLYLAQAMKDQDVHAIGGPNITPPDDGLIAWCIAASPGNPSHVMLDDRLAEHVPGCNMAFRRSTLLGLGGFDSQFRVAGDDVDICWRLLDAELRIGYAPGAMVWHHRRATVDAFSRQQKGYGRSEAMVHFKHPSRCGALGRSQWKGIIYGDGAVGLPLMPDQIYHGHFGTGLFQTIYRHNNYGIWSCIMSVEWHLAAAFMLMLSTLTLWFLAVAAAMWIATAGSAIRSASRAPVPRHARWWCHGLVAYLYLMQPIWRGWNRLTHLLRHRRLPHIEKRMHLLRRAWRSCAGRKQAEVAGKPTMRARRGSNVQDWFCDCYHGTGRDELLNNFVHHARRLGWIGDYDNGWSEWDVKLAGDCWYDIVIRTATEELGWPRRFTRARVEVHNTSFSRVAVAALLIWTTVALVTGTLWAQWLAVGCTLLVAITRWISRAQCFRVSGKLLRRSWRSVTSADQPKESLPQSADGLAPTVVAVPHDSVDRSAASTSI